MPFINTFLHDTKWLTWSDPIIRERHGSPDGGSAPALEPVRCAAVCYAAIDGIAFVLPKED